MRITLKAARVNAGYTLEQVAEKTGYDRKTLSNWERGVNIPRADKLSMLCSLYKISQEYIRLK